ncbi:hypothetical protein LBMAG53_07770 [Planctomycetota bacterium]|nr:hypothetical protein LBMAG53_07770 [Planctomycetota bacterium]
MATLTAADIPAHVDVCVYAATPAGCTAALAVAREGRSVLIIEPSRWVGGILGAGIKPLQDCPNPSSIGGLARETNLHGGKLPAATRAYFLERLSQARIPVLYEHRLAAVSKDGSRIVSVRCEHAPPDAWGVPPAEALPGPGRVVTASCFIDASYEGDLMARAGVSFAIGREGSDRYHEQYAGVGKPTNVTPIDPFIAPGDPGSGLLWQVESDHGKPQGAADDYTQAYNFRFYVTSDPARRVPFTPPADYDPARFELVGRFVAHLVAHGQDQAISGIFPGWLNDGEYNYQRHSLVSIAPLGLSRRYQDGGYAERSAIWRAHIDWMRGIHHFLTTDERVPPIRRAAIAALGLDRTHHPDTDGWPHQLYVRIARRLVGRYVLTEADVMNRTTVDDAVGLGQYGVDTYPVRRIAINDTSTGRMVVATEGNMFIGGNAGTGTPYGIPYRALTPETAQCSNLLVPVCCSASYIAYAASRMEPVFQVLGESAGVAASQAVAQGVAVQEVSLPALRSRLVEVGQVLAAPVKLHGKPSDR